MQNFGGQTRCILGDMQVANDKLSCAPMCQLQTETPLRKFKLTKTTLFKEGVKFVSACQMRSIHRNGRVIYKQS